MAAGRANSKASLAASSGARLSQLWQLPLLLVSLGLFGYAAYLFIDPHAGPTLDAKIDAARVLLNQERPQKALDLLNATLESTKLDNKQQGEIHLMLGEAIDMWQKQQHKKIKANFLSIIEQTKLALAHDVQPDAMVYRRLGDAYAGLNRSREALKNYRSAMELDVDRKLRLQRIVIDLQLAQDDPSAADGTLVEYLKDQTLSDSEKAWALGTRAQLMIDDGKFADAHSLLNDALKLASDRGSMGEVNYRQGYCAYKLGDPLDAERFLRVARDQLTTSRPMDADAAYLLGKILLDRGDAKEALSFFADVLESHIDSPIEPLARLGRGQCRIMLHDDPAGLEDLRQVVDEITEKVARQKFRDEAVAGLQQASRLLAARQSFDAALEVLAYEQSLVPDPPAGFFGRLANVYEQRGDELASQVAQAAPADRIRREQQARDARIHAGDAYIAYSHKLILIDDKAYSQSMWKGVDLYEKAGDLPRMISTLELFVVERPDDKLTPDALLRLGVAYQNLGEFDKAISTFQRNQFRYPNSLAASKSAIPLAQAYIAKGPEAYKKAETTLLSVLDNNPLVTPEAEEFKQSLFDLAQLYYRTSRYEESIKRLEEYSQRYPKQEREGELLFLMGDSYRKSAQSLDMKPGAPSADAVGNPPLPDLAEVAAAKTDRLHKAKELYDRVVENFRNKPPERDIDKLYMKLAHFYRADCLYDLHEYPEAIKLYDAAAFRYQDDPSALAAYVQIVNSYCALGKIEEAKTANERAKWILRRMPPDAFKDGAFPMPKEYWEAWLQWTSNAGMW